MKKYIVRLTDEERKLCDETIDKLVGAPKARRARIHANWMRTGRAGLIGRWRAYRPRADVENRRRPACKGFRARGRRATAPPVPKLLDGEAGGTVIAALDPPEGYGINRRLLAQREWWPWDRRFDRHETGRPDTQKIVSAGDKVQYGLVAGDRRQFVGAGWRVFGIPHDRATNGSVHGRAARAIGTWHRGPA